MAVISTRTDWILQELSERILTGGFAPGERLKAQELAAEWNVSPTPVREALQRLAVTGLVQALPNRGMRVAPVDEAEVREVYSLRLLLEPFALRASMEAGDAAWAEAVGTAFDRLEAAIRDRSHDLVAFEVAHAAFHEALLSRAQSVWLRRIVGSLRVHSTRHRLMSLVPRGGWDEVLVEHRRLCRVCVGGEIDAAVAELFTHIKQTVDAVAAGGSPHGIADHIDVAGRLAHLAA